MGGISTGQVPSRPPGRQGAASPSPQAAGSRPGRTLGSQPPAAPRLQYGRRGKEEGRQKRGQRAAGRACGEIRLGGGREMKGVGSGGKRSSTAGAAPHPAERTWGPIQPRQQLYSLQLGHVPAQAVLNRSVHLQAGWGRAVGVGMNSRGAQRPAERLAAATLALHRLCTQFPGAHAPGGGRGREWRRGGPRGVETRPAAAIPASDLLHVGCCDLRGRLLGFGRRWGGLGVDAGAAHLGGCSMCVAGNSGVNKHGRGQDSPRRLTLMAQQSQHGWLTFAPAWPP